MTRRVNLPPLAHSQRRQMARERPLPTVAIPLPPLVANRSRH